MDFAKIQLNNLFYSLLLLCFSVCDGSVHKNSSTQEDTKEYYPLGPYVKCNYL